MDIAANLIKGIYDIAENPLKYQCNPGEPRTMNFPWKNVIPSVTAIFIFQACQFIKGTAKYYGISGSDLGMAMPF